MMFSMRILPAAAAAAMLLGGGAAAVEDTSPPVISHTPITRGEKGKQTPVFARVTDESKIFPQIFFRFGPASPYEKPIDMKPVRGQRNQWGGNLPPPPGDVIEYYIEAYDEFGNGPARAGDPDQPFRIDFGPVQMAQPPPLPPATAAAAPAAAAGRSGGRQWTWFVGGLGLGLLTGGIVANPLGSPRATALDVAGGTLIATSVVLYFVEAPKEPKASPPPRRAAQVQMGATPIPGGGALAVSGRF
jgi:hypothetical protein